MALSGQLEAGVSGAYPKELTEPLRNCELACLGGTLLLSYNLVTFKICLLCSQVASYTREDMRREISKHQSVNLSTISLSRQMYT